MTLTGARAPLRCATRWWFETSVFLCSIEIPVGKPDTGMDYISCFKTILPYLTHPLVLAGLALLLSYGLLNALLEAEIIRPLSPGARGRVVRSILRFGFAVALIAIVLGFSLAAYQTDSQHDPVFQKGEIEKKRLDARIAAASATYCQHPEKFTLDEVRRHDADRACAEAVVALANISDAPTEKTDDALARLVKGDAQGAKAIFREILERKSAEGAAANNEAAEAARHLGSLAFYDNTYEALAAYRKAVELNPGNPDGWNQLGHLLLRVGQLNDAETSYRKVESLGTSRDERGWLAAAYSNLGLVYQARGSLVEAETMLRKALEIDEMLGYKAGMACDYGNLGIVYQMRGNLTQAEAMHKHALEIDEALGIREGMANQYNNLGALYLKRGNLVQAEVMHKKALEIDEALGFKEGIANAYGNLGMIHRARGQLGPAQEMLTRALNLHEALGLKQGVANSYGNLGLVFEMRGDFAQAETMQTKALGIDEAIGFKAGTAIAYANLGHLYARKGDSVKAEAMRKKALAIDEAIGLKAVPIEHEIPVPSARYNRPSI
jgi:protein O-GlcNAc transferase